MIIDRPLAVVSPTLDGEVLAVLAGGDVTFTAGQVHRSLRRFSEHGIRKVLVRLVAQGIVTAERAGPTTVYGLNRDHLAAGAISELLDSRRRLLARFAAVLVAWPEPPVYAAVFGSAATGGMRTDSDIDLLLVSRNDGPQWDAEIADLMTLTVRWTGNPLGLVQMSEAELIQRAGEPLARSIGDTALTVMGSRAWLDRQLREGRRRADA